MCSLHVHVEESTWAHSFDHCNGQRYLGLVRSMKFESPCVWSGHSRKPENEFKGSNNGQKLLGWPKSSFRFFCKVLKENSNKHYDQPNCSLMEVNGNIQDLVKAGTPKPEYRKKQLHFLSKSQLGLKALQHFVECSGQKYTSLQLIKYE